MAERRDADSPMVNLVSYCDDGHDTRSHALSPPSLLVTDSTLLDIQLLGEGTYAPLRGFVTHEDWACIVQSMQLHSGEVWPIPITLPVSEAEALMLEDQVEVCLQTSDGQVCATLQIQDIFPLDKLREAECVYRTVDETHDGVKQLYEREEYCVSGPISLCSSFARRVTASPAPADVHAMMAARGWQTVIGILMHENCIEEVSEVLTACLTGAVDGALIQVVTSSPGSESLLSCCQSVKALMAEELRCRSLVLPYPDRVRHAGAREVLMQALVQRNFGCTHVALYRSGCLDLWADLQVVFRKIDFAALGIQPIYV